MRESTQQQIKLEFKPSDFPIQLFCLASGIQYKCETYNICHHKPHFKLLIGFYFCEPVSECEIKFIREKPQCFRAKFLFCQCSLVLIWFFFFFVFQPKIQLTMLLCENDNVFCDYCKQRFHLQFIFCPKSREFGTTIKLR